MKIETRFAKAPESVTVCVIMGVAGSGKTTLGRALAKVIDGLFFDGDDYHPEVNIEKMSRGEALNDADRKPWLKRITILIKEAVLEQKPVIIACSALKKSYREELSSGEIPLKFVYLHASHEVLVKRLKSRYEKEAHFMQPKMLDSQLEALEKPQTALVLDATESVQVLVNRVEEAYFS